MNFVIFHFFSVHLYVGERPFFPVRFTSMIGPSGLDTSQGDGKNVTLILLLICHWSQITPYVTMLAVECLQGLIYEAVCQTESIPIDQALI
jgi:hypothetical protein